jgi:hypothetical protein
MHGDSLVPLLEGGDPGPWDRRVVVSEEPINFLPAGPAPAGSFLLGRWQVIFSHGHPPSGTPVRLGPDEPPPPPVTVLDFRSDGGRGQPLVEAEPALRPYYWRGMAALQGANTATHERLVGAGKEHIHSVDPATVERLKELGYLQ